VLLLQCLCIEAFVLRAGGVFSPAVGDDAKPLAAAASFVTACSKRCIATCRGWLVQSKLSSPQGLEAFARGYSWKLSRSVGDIHKGAHSGWIISKCCHLNTLVHCTKLWGVLDDDNGFKKMMLLGDEVALRKQRCCNQPITANTPRPELSLPRRSELPPRAAAATLTILSKTTQGSRNPYSAPGFLETTSDIETACAGLPPQHTTFAL
jgi:hypothetical protein